MYVMLTGPLEFCMLMFCFVVFCLSFAAWGHSRRSGGCPASQFALVFLLLLLLFPWFGLFVVCYLKPFRTVRSLSSRSVCCFLLSLLLLFACFVSFCLSFAAWGNSQQSGGCPAGLFALVCLRSVGGCLLACP